MMQNRRLKIENWKLKSAKCTSRIIVMDRLISGNFQSSIFNPQFPISTRQSLDGE